MEFLQVDVFAGGPYEGNALAVFPDASELERGQMQPIAREMNLSETTFVTEVDEDSYRVRIFTPLQEMPFAGHPTIGTAWVLRHLGRLRADEIVQLSPAGSTTVRAQGERLWFERGGEAEADLDEANLDADRAVGAALGLEPVEIGLEARELGRAGRLRPAFADAGLRQLMVPLRSPEALAACAPVPALVTELADNGLYCFTAARAGELRARGFFPGVGVSEDPATGSAAAALGLYLARRVGSIQFGITQGVEIGRSSHIEVRAEPGRVEVGGRCALVLTGRLERVPQTRPAAAWP